LSWTALFLCNDTVKILYLCAVKSTVNKILILLTIPVILASSLSIIWSHSKQNHSNNYTHATKIKNTTSTCYININCAAELSDKIKHYLKESYRKGVQTVPRTTRDIRKLHYQGKLLFIEPCEYYLVDTMYHSYAFLTPKAFDFLQEMGERFHKKLENTGLECTQLSLTSLIRTITSIKSLQSWNKNSVTVSSHLHGTTFDVSYRTFYSKKKLSAGEIKYLGDQLTKTVWEMRNEGKCYATYEYWQTCIHVVVR
jgi:hypothetical protein